MSQPSRKDKKLKNARKHTRRVEQAYARELMKAQYIIRMLSEQAGHYRNEILRLRGVLNEHQLERFAVPEAPPGPEAAASGDGQLVSPPDSQSIEGQQDRLERESEGSADDSATAGMGCSDG